MIEFLKELVQESEGTGVEKQNWEGTEEKWLSHVKCFLIFFPTCTSPIRVSLLGIFTSVKIKSACSVTLIIPISNVNY